MSTQFWYHEPTGSFGLVSGQFIEFEFDGRMEESFWPLLKEQGEWIYVGKLGEKE